MVYMEVIAVLIGISVGVALTWVVMRRQKTQLADTFRALSAEALSQNNQSFLHLAKTNLEKFQESARADLEKRQATIDQLVKPVHASLEKFESKISHLEKARTESHASLRQQLSSLMGLQQQLQTETTKLSSALKATTVRGRWGEIQLRRVVELAGMLNHCDFYEQQTAEGGRKRPDLIVRLPAGRQIIVDAKAPLDAYLEASDTTDETTRTELLRKHAAQIRQHVRALASKAYTDHFDETPEFVVLFLPGEIFFSAALAQDPTLIEVGAEQGVIIATPTTLIALLRAVFYGWKQEAISRDARRISEMGRELYKRIASVGTHFARVGKSLEGATKAYNDAVGSLERRVLPKAREFEHLDRASSTLDVLPTVEQTPRPLQAPELDKEVPSEVG